MPKSTTISGQRPVKNAGPVHWPPDVTYIDASRYAKDLPVAVREHLEGRPVAGRQRASAVPVLEIPPSMTIIRRIEDSNHPAHGQRGLFAAKAIPPKTFIVQYMGEIHVDDRPLSDYDLSLDKIVTPPVAEGAEATQISIGIDAASMGNEARFVNDYRGTGVPRPNAFFKELRGKEGMLHMTIWTGKEPIAKGKEILVSYGKGWWAARSQESSETVG